MRETPANAAFATGHALYQLARTPVYQNGQLSLSLGETVTAERLRETWQQMLASHPLLRTSFKQSGGTIMQRLSETAELNWRSLDWRNVPPAELGSRWSATLAEEAGLSVDLAGPSLVRFLVLELPGGHCHLLATFPKFLLDEDTLFRILCDWLSVLEGHRAAEAATEESEPSPVGESTLAWWRQALASAGTPLALNIHPKSTAESGREEFKHLFDRETTSALRQLPCDPALAAWALVLARLTARDETLLLAATGHPAHLLPCSIPVDGDVTIHDWLHHLCTTEKERASHAELSLPAILALKESGNKLEDFSIAYERRPVSLSDRIHDFSPRWINLDARLHEQSAFPLYCEVRDGDRMGLRVEFDPARYPTAEVEKILNRTVRILETLPEDQTRRLSSLSVLSESERTVFSETSKGSSLKTPKIRIEEDIADVALANPDADAVQGPGEAGLSYADIVSYAGSLAAHLRTQNLAEGWNIAICLTPTPWLPVALLGVLQAGDTVIPLDNTAKSSWLLERLEECDVELIICDSRTAAQFRHGAKKFLVIDQQWEEIAIAESNDFSPAPKVSAFLTGLPAQTPPPVRAISPALLATTCHQARKLWNLQPGDRVPLTATPGTGRYIEEILAPLAAGATLVFSETEETFSALDELAPTHIVLSSPQFESWVYRHKTKQTELPQSLRLVIVEAGAETTESYLLWPELHGGRVEFLQFHSPAGFSGLSLNFRASAEEIPPLSLGLPGQGLEIHLRDSVGHPLPPYHMGQLFFLIPGHPEPLASIDGWRDDRGTFHAIFAKREPAPTPVEEKPAPVAPQTVPTAAPSTIHPEPAAQPVPTPVEAKKVESKLSGFFKKFTGGK